MVRHRRAEGTPAEVIDTLNGESSGPRRPRLKAQDRRSRRHGACRFGRRVRQIHRGETEKWAKVMKFSHQGRIIPKVSHEAAPAHFSRLAAGTAALPSLPRSARGNLSDAAGAPDRSGSGRRHRRHGARLVAQSDVGAARPADRGREPRRRHNIGTGRDALATPDGYTCCWIRNAINVALSQSQIQFHFATPCRSPASSARRS